MDFDQSTMKVLPMMMLMVWKMNEMVFSSKKLVLGNSVANNVLILIWILIMTFANG